MNKVGDTFKVLWFKDDGETAYNKVITIIVHFFPHYYANEWNSIVFIYVQ